MRNLFLSTIALLVYGLACSVVSGLMAWEAWQKYDAGRTDDLTSVEGRLAGPQSQRRSVHDRWGVWEGDRYVGGFTTTEGNSLVLIWNRDEVTARLAHDLVVEVVTPEGFTVRSLDVGVRGAVRDLCLALVATGGALGFGRLAIRRRRAWGSWTSASGPWVMSVDGSTLALIAGSLLVLAGIRVGLSWQAALVAAAAVVAVAAWRWNRNQLR